MNKTALFGVGVVIAALGLGFIVINSSKQPAPVPQEPKPSAMMEKTEEKPAAKKTIVEIASEAGNFTTLVAAVKAAGLAETLSGTGPFTVFAPTDEAFTKLPVGTVESLLKDKEKLSAILTYHVVSGKVMATDVVKMTSVKTVQGQSVSIKVDGDTVMVNGAKVIQTDIEASNGVIHAIDSVILPQ